MTRVLVTGSRDWEDEDEVWNQLLLAYYDFGGAYRGTGEFTIVHGDCPTGADKMADAFGAYHDFSVEPHPADWYPDPDHKYDVTAGHKRNQLMVDLGADVCLAFFMPCRKPSCPKVNIHPSHGTTDCAKRAKRAGIEVRPFGMECEL